MKRPHIVNEAACTLFVIAQILSQFWRFLPPREHLVHPPDGTITIPSFPRQVKELTGGEPLAGCPRPHSIFLSEQQWVKPPLGLREAPNLDDGIMETRKTINKFSPEARVGCGEDRLQAETLHNWLRQPERDAGMRSGATTDERERIKAPERERGSAGQ
jgi:hypothetical protein